MSNLAEEVDPDKKTTLASLSHADLFKLGSLVVLTIQRVLDVSRSKDE